MSGFIICARAAQCISPFAKVGRWVAMCLTALPILAGTVNAITINIEYSTDFGGDESPTWDPNGAILKAHFQAAKQIWEALLPGPGSYEFDFQYDNDIDNDDPNTLALTTDNAIDTFIEVNPDVDWFCDPTPGDDAEFDVTIGQTLFRDLPSPLQSSVFPGNPPPGALEVGYRGTGSAVPSASGAAGVNASNGYDMLSTIVHEIGHILGISGVEPGDYNMDPQHVGGVGGVLVLEDPDSGHLGGDGTVPFLMCEACGQRGVRRFPTATDILVIAEDQGIGDVHLKRVGSITGGSWSNSHNWIGDDVPGLSEDVYIRHGGNVSLAGDAQARNLRVGDGSSLTVYSNHLTVDGGLMFDGGSISVGTGGTITADVLTGDPAATTTIADSLVQFNVFTRSASSTATTANFSGNVQIGYAPVAGGAVLLSSVFQPSSISLWNIAEKLSIGGANTISTLAITAGTDFNSATGRIGAYSAFGGIGNVNIDGVGSSWTVSGALDARRGALNVVNKGLLVTGSVNLGASDGQMRASVNDAKWTVNGNIDIGPPTPTGVGWGTLVVQNNGKVTATGSLDVHGTSSLVSEVTVESSATLDVSGNVIVRPYSKVTFRDYTSADPIDGTFTNYGGTVTGNSFGSTQFAGHSTAGSRVFVNNGGIGTYSPGGVTQFTDDASANHGNFTNNGGGAIWEYGGQTIFSGASTAAFATITNYGPSGLYAFVGKTVFNDTASGGSATITNLPSSGGPTTTDFYGTSNAGSATIINKSGPYSFVAGITTFHNSSSAGNGNFINESALAGGNGQFEFRDSSTAGQGTFTNGDYGGFVTFYNNSTAGQANIMLRGKANTVMIFYDNSSAGTANIDIGRLTYGLTNEFNDVNFYQNSTAANSTITVRGDGGRLSFAGNYDVNGNPSASASNAVIVALGSTWPGNISGTVPGQVLFNSYSTAGNASITAQAATVAGAPGGLVVFLNGGHAGSASITANGGATAANGGGIRFQGSAVGDSARLIVNAGAFADFSTNSTSGTAVGSIEGAGSFYLGATLLTVGNRNTDTNVSGVISDLGGYTSATGGKLTKVGTGVLSLDGANAYTGLTTVSQGALVINGSIVGAAAVNSGGTLKGTGTIGGTVTVNAGGVFAPGTSPGTISVGGLNLMSGSTLKYELGAIRDHIVVTGNANILLGGALDLSILAGFDPAPGQTFALFEGAVGSIIGTFSTVHAPIFNGHTLNLVYSANQATLHVINAVLPPGDFNGNGSVDAADYIVWRKGLGTTYTQSDYSVWRANFGATAGSGAGVGVAVPEPTSVLLLAIPAFCQVARTRRVRPGRAA